MQNESSLYNSYCSECFGKVTFCHIDIFMTSDHLNIEKKIQIRFFKNFITVVSSMFFIFRSVHGVQQHTWGCSRMNNAQNEQADQICWGDWPPLTVRHYSQACDYIFRFFGATSCFLSLQAVIYQSFKDWNDNFHA